MALSHGNPSTMTNAQLIREIERYALSASRWFNYLDGSTAEHAHWFGLLEDRSEHNELSLWEETLWGMEQIVDMYNAHVAEYNRRFV